MILNRKLKKVQNLIKIYTFNLVSDSIMNDIECNALSAEGIKSYDYVRWKEETLANQTSHKVLYKYLIILSSGKFDIIFNQNKITKEIIKRRQNSEINYLTLTLFKAETKEVLLYEPH